MSRSKTPSFVHTFDLLEKTPGGFRFARQASDHSRRLFNATLGVLVRRVRAAKASPEWAAARRLPKGARERGESFDAAAKKHGLSLYEAMDVATEFRKSSREFAERVGSHVAQNVGERAWRAAEKLLHAKAKRVRFKRKEELVSFEGKDNKMFLRLMWDEDGAPEVWLGSHRFKVVYDKENPYDVHALSSRVKFVRMLWKKVRGRERLCAQLVLEGLPYEDKEKARRHREKFEAAVGPKYKEELAVVDAEFLDVVGVDIGPRVVGVSNAVVGFERPIADDIDERQAEIRRLQRKMDRSRRASNPDNYNADGTIKRGKKLVWRASRTYRKDRTRLADMHGRQAAHRKSIHGNLVNEVLQYGKIVKCEALSYAALQRRYGRSVKHHAPSAFIGELTRKAALARGRGERINTYDTALSQHCPSCGGRKKKKLSERRHRCEKCGYGMACHAPRDLTSAFLAVFTRNDDVLDSPFHKEKRGRKKPRGRSKLDQGAASRHLSGHRTLSGAGSTRTDASKGETARSSDRDGGGAAPLDASAKRPSAPLEPSGKAGAKASAGRRPEAVERDGKRIHSLKRRRKARR